MQVADGAPVAIIGHGVKTRFFTTEEPIGKPIKVGNVWLTVVGVLEDRKVSDQTSQKLGIRDANMDVYVPLSTMLLRYRNRAQVTEQDVQQASREFNDDPNAHGERGCRAARRACQLPSARSRDRARERCEVRDRRRRRHAAHADAPAQLR